MTPTDTRPVETETFQSEEALVQAFVSALESAAASLPADAILREFGYGRGRTDVVTVGTDGEVLAFEAKLTKWRDALCQAYRNTCFAHRSFVVLPWQAAQRAAQYAAEFDRRGVGLCAVRAGQVTVIHEAIHRAPIEPWLSETASAAARAAAIQ